MNNTLKEKQADKHTQEQTFVKWLLAHPNGHTIKDATNTSKDFKNGIDLEIDGQPVDLKVTNSRKLSLFRKSDLYDKHDGREGWECPILKHPNIPYLIIENHPEKKRYVGFLIRKLDLFNYLHLAPIGTYTGDGNVNKYLDLSNIITDVTSEILVFDY